MDTVFLERDKEQTGDVELTPKVAGAQEFALQVIVLPGGDPITLPLRILWAPPPDLRFTTASSSCGARLCLTKGSPEQIRIDGDDRRDVNARGTAHIEFLKADNTVAASPPDSPLDPGANGGYAFFSIGGQNATDVTAARISVPLLVPRLRWKAAAGGAAPTGDPNVLLEDTVTQDAHIVTPPRPQARVLYALADGKTEVLSYLRGASTGVPVRIQGDPQVVPAFTALERTKRYDLREQFAGSTGSVAAELYVEDKLPGDSGLVGVLMPRAATRMSSGRDAPSVLVFGADGKPDVAVQVTVLPRMENLKYVVLHPRRPEEVNGAVTPMQQVGLRIEGPGVAKIKSAQFGGKTLTPHAPQNARDSVWLNVEVPRGASQSERLVLRDLDDVDVVVPIKVAPPAAPRGDFAFVKIALRQRGGPLDVSLARDAPDAHSVKSLQNVVLRFYPDSIDRPDSLFGVQYVRVDMQLLDAEGNERATSSKCYAIVPPALPGMLYSVDGSNGCTQVASDEVSLSGLLEPAKRATAKSQLRITVHHEPGRYPNDEPPRQVALVMERSGWLVLDAAYQLPAPVIAVQGGRFSTGIDYGGALFNAMPVFGNMILNSTHAFAVQAGAVMGSYAKPSETSNQGLDARLAALLGGTYTFRNMIGNVTLNFFVGRVFPVTGNGFRSRDSFLVFRPGFTVPIGNPAKVGGA